MHTEIIDKSKFVSYKFDVTDTNEVKRYIEEIKQEHKKATHVVYAYYIKNNNNETSGYSEDGEPSGTAGKPIRNLLILKKVSNILIIVVRYFGGKKLGAGKLLRAYVKSSKIFFE